MKELLLDRETKIKAMLALKDKLITIEEFDQGCIYMVKQEDGSYIRAATGEKYIDLEKLKNSIPCVKGIIRRGENRILGFFDLLGLLKSYTAKEHARKKKMESELNRIENEPENKN